MSNIALDEIYVQLSKLHLVIKRFIFLKEGTDKWFDHATGIPGGQKQDCHNY